MLKGGDTNVDLQSLQNFFYSGNFIPHGHCYLWKPELVSLHILSDVLIALSYYSIPLTLVYFIRKRVDIPFKSIFLLFGAFIISCGTTHIVEVWTLWHPDYWFAGALKAVTALISFYTALTLIPLVPKALALPSPAQLETANQALMIEIIERKRVESELRKYKDHLEEIVQTRTGEWESANAQLQQEIKERQQSQDKMVGILKELRSANQELNDFAYVVSHDLKAPLRGITSLSEWLLADYGEEFDEEGKKMVNLMISRVKRLHKLIDDILQYSRVGRAKVEKKHVDLNQVVSELIEVLNIPENIKIEISNQLPTINCDKTRIGQLFQNLISNAIKFIDKPEGLVKITCVDEQEYYRFSVADNGIGIEPQHFEKIFQLFQKLTSLQDSDSTGVGLALVKKIVELHDGKIWVESEIGVGTSFIFTLKK
ncbi:integral membrane sensor hybrid histidine kinase [Calothrix sp. NIES-4071]|nr:integral membrane sensor hybrid histidine kinase [Calothrix sp. NIES-4071]BAZ58890.1 integral membrane sensor hybrid histidine kinase [Calothrix sp. NIES-4105]